MHKIRISYHIKSDHIKLYLYTYICYVYYVYTLKGSFLRGCPSKPLLPVWHRGPGELCGELVGVPRSGDQTWTRRWKILEGSIENGGFNEWKSNISCNQLNGISFNHIQPAIFINHHEIYQEYWENQGKLLISVVFFYGMIESES